MNTSNQNEGLPLVSIVILNWNNQNLLQRCLISVLCTNYSNYEVIVVDNGSTDGSPAMVRREFPTVTLIENERNLGWSEGNNRGIRQSKGNYIILLNEDTEVDPNWLIELIKVAKSDERIGILGCKIYYIQSRRILQHAGGIIGKHAKTRHIGDNQVDRGQFDEIAYPDYVIGAAFMIKRELLNEIGLLDPIYFAFYEDTDICYRAKKFGYKVAYVPSAIVYHHKGASWRLDFVSVRRFYLGERNRVRFVFKNYDLPQVVFWLLLEIIIIIRELGKLVLRGGVSYFQALISAYLWNMKNFRKTRQLKNHVFR